MMPAPDACPILPEGCPLKVSGIRTGGSSALLILLAVGAQVGDKAGAGGETIRGSQFEGECFG